MKTLGLLIAIFLTGPVLADQDLANGAPTLHFANHLLVDGNGMTVYVFDNDVSSSSTCYGQCAQAWPPVLAQPGSEPLPTGASTSPRTDGATQLTYHGRPVYLYFGDSKVGDRTGDGLGGIWHIVPDTAP